LDELLDKKNIESKKSIIKTISDSRYQNKDLIVDYFYDLLVTHRIEHLKQFYKNYFYLSHNYKWNQQTILSTNSDKTKTISLQKNDKSKVVLRNLYYLELLDKTLITNSVKSHVSFWQSLVNLFNYLQIEGRFFATSSIMLLLKKKPNNTHNYQTSFYLLQQYQPKASILNPYTIHWIFNNLFSSDCQNVFTPVLSWSAYLLAFMYLPKYTHYVGVDVMQSVINKSKFLFDFYNSKLVNVNKTCDFYCSPSEKLIDDKQFLQKYTNYFDVCIICPPYYTMELYHEGFQSTSLYNSYTSWLKGYWEPTVKLIHICLKKNKYFGLIVNNYEDLNHTFYPLVKDLSDIVLKSKFKLNSEYYLVNRASPLRSNKKDRTERLIIFIK
jgi:hypothetical protein